MKTAIMLKILDRLEWLIVRNRTYEAKRLIRQEIENIKGITEQQCKKFKLNKTYCKVCTNLNCNYNQKYKQDDKNKNVKIQKQV